MVYVHILFILSHISSKKILKCQNLIILIIYLSNLQYVLIIKPFIDDIKLFTSFEILFMHTFENSLCACILFYPI